MKLTKQDSIAVKGIAIILLIFHHLFYNPKSFGGMDITFTFVDTEAVILLSSWAKVCVPLFVFLTSYGLCAKYKTVKYDKTKIKTIIIKRYFSLIIPFIYIFGILQIVCNIPIFDSGRTFVDVYGKGEGCGLYIILDAFGLAHCFGTPTLFSTWWYMTLAALLIFMSPFIGKLVELFGSTVFLSMFILFRLSGWTGSGCFDYILIAVLGAVVFEADFFDRIILNKNHFLTMAISFSIIGLSLYCCVSLATAGGFQDIVFCLSVVAIIFFYKHFLVKVKPICNILRFLGTYSLNIFLTHAFLKAYLFQDLIRIFENGFVIWCIFMVLSVILAWLFDMLYRLSRIDKLQLRIIEFVDKRFIMWNVK